MKRTTQGIHYWRGVTTTARSRIVCAITLLEVLVAIAVIVLLGVVLWACVFRARSANALACKSTQKSVALGFRLFVNDHGDKLSWAVSTNDMGSKEFVETPDVFRHFLVASNEFNTPKILRCRADTVKRTTIDWAGFANSNVSYFVGVTADERLPRGLLLGDRNIMGGTLSNGCMRTLSAMSTVVWSRDIHVEHGNVALVDGSVSRTDAKDLQKLVESAGRPSARLAIP